MQLLKSSTAALTLAALLASLASGTLAAAVVTPCANTQLTFGLPGKTPAPADACFGWLEANGNPRFETDLVEARFGTDPASPWTFVLKDGGSGATGGFAGLELTLDAEQSPAGAFRLSWTDPTPADLPLTLDLVIVIKAGQGTAGFLLEDLALPTTPTSGGGNFEVGILNDRGRALSLSHMSLIMGRGDTTAIPEPAPLAVMATALLALTLGRRTR
jgi:hypothetical protein